MLYVLFIHCVFVTATYVQTTLSGVVHVMLCCVSMKKLGHFPFYWRLTSTLSVYGERTMTQVTLALIRHANLDVRRQSRPLTCVDKQELKKTLKIMEIGPSYWIGLLHQTVWGLVGTSCKGDPMNVGRSSTVNISGTRRRVEICLWLNVLSPPPINHLVKAVTCTPLTYAWL